MELLNHLNKQEYLAFAENCPKAHFAQSPEWAAVKSEWKAETVLVRNADGKIAGSAQILFREMPLVHKKLAYCSRGPVCDIHDADILCRVLEDAKSLAKERGAYLLKIDPDVAVSDTAFAAVMEREGFERKPFNKNFEGIQPRFVFRLNVEGKSEEEVFAGFHSKWRYNVRVAQKNGVEVKIAPREELVHFHRIMLETGMRDNFVTRSLDYFERMYDALGAHCRLYMAYYEGAPIAGTLAIHYGDKVWYLYGASSNAYRNVMPNYLLQWEMIRWAIAEHCRLYDFRGVSGDLSEDNPLYGLYRFKKGFGGDLTEFCGEFDYVIDRPCKMFLEKGEKLYKKFIRTAYKLKNRAFKK